MITIATRYFKLWIRLAQNKGLYNQVANIQGLKIRVCDNNSVTSENWLEFRILEYHTELKISQIYELVGQILKYAEIPKIRELI